MKKLRKVELYIYEEKLTEFYLSLLHWKSTDKADIEVLRTIANAIHFDEESLAQGIEISPAQKERITEQMQSVHEFLFKSRKDSEDYYTVSKENTEAFTASPFGKDLYNQLYGMEVRKLLTGKEESTEAKTSIAVFTKFITSLLNALATTIELPLFEDKPGVYAIKADKNGYLLYEFGQGDYKIEAGLFIETSKGIKHIHPANDLFLLSEEEDISTLYLSVNDDSIRLSEKDAAIELTVYENVKTDKGFMYISNARKGQTLTIPKELFKNGEIPEAELFKMVEKEFTRILKLPVNTPEQIESRDRDIMSIYILLSKHFPAITQHAACTIVGYIAGVAGLLDSEGLYIISERKMPYRKYLRDTVYNIIQKHQA